MFLELAGEVLWIFNIVVDVMNTQNLLHIAEFVRKDSNKNRQSVIMVV